MRIVVNGQQKFGEEVLSRLLERGEDVVAVCTAPDAEGRPLDPLKELALARGIPVHQPTTWKSAQALDLMQSFECDICMMAYVLLFVPEDVLNAPRLGSFQYHPSLLPMHRGPSSINWPIAMGAGKTGLSIFWPDKGLDEGPILMRKECEIGADDTLGDVYFKKLFPMGVDAMIESLDLLKAGTAPKLPQNLTEGSYESWFGKAEARVDWSQPATQIYNIIRAANPQPGAWTTRDGATLQIYDSRLGKSGPAGKPGQVVAIGDESITVAAGTGTLEVRRVRAQMGKVAVADYVAETSLATGHVLGS